MVDTFTLALMHGVIALAMWRLLLRDDLDTEGAETTAPRRQWIKGRGGSSGDSRGAGDA